ncbi:Uncharacterised protein g9446 [Pycnogonum litorale]
MKVTLVLVILAVFCSQYLCMRSESANWSGEQRRQKRSVLEFSSMLKAKTGVEAIEFATHGKHCSVIGISTEVPIDELDRCCKDHTTCYNTQLTGCFLGGSTIYSYEISTSGVINCNSVLNDDCQKRTCNCDKIGAECYNDNKHFLGSVGAGTTASAGETTTSAGETTKGTSGAGTSQMYTNIIALSTGLTTLVSTNLAVPLIKPSFLIIFLLTSPAVLICMST